MIPKYRCIKCDLSLEGWEFRQVTLKGCTYRRNVCYTCELRDSREYYRKNRVKIIQQKLERYKHDPFRVRARAMNERCDKGMIYSRDLRRLVQESGGNCYYCGCLLEDNFCIDHALPIARGGSNEYENLRVCCPQCNQEKGVSTAEDFMLGRNGVPF